MGAAIHPSCAVLHASDNTPDPITAVMMCAVHVKPVPSICKRQFYWDHKTPMKNLHHPKIQNCKLVLGFSVSKREYEIEKEKRHEELVWITGSYYWILFMLRALVYFQRVMNCHCYCFESLPEREYLAASAKVLKEGGQRSNLTFWNEWFIQNESSSSHFQMKRIGLDFDVTNQECEESKKIGLIW